MRRYRFIGRACFIPKKEAMPPRFHVTSPDAVVDWIERTQPEPEWDTSLPATFIVDQGGTMWIADRRSEHVACARLGDVLAAGEIFFEHNAGAISAARVTNQSTGYCTEPESFPAVAQSLSMVGIDCPSEYDPAFTFRYCHPCQNVCIIKDDDFTCPVCSGALPLDWNFEGVTVGP